MNAYDQRTRVAARAAEEKAVTRLIHRASAWAAVDEIARDPTASAADIAQVVYEQQETLEVLDRH